MPYPSTRRSSGAVIEVAAFARRAHGYIAAALVFQCAPRRARRQANERAKKILEREAFTAFIVSAFGASHVASVLKARATRSTTCCGGVKSQLAPSRRNAQAEP